MDIIKPQSGVGGLTPKPKNDNELNPNNIQDHLIAPSTNIASLTFGIISFHHADNRINRGVPAGFWEVYLKQDATGFTIQQLTEEIDGGNVLFRGQVTTKRTFLFNQAILYEKSNYYLKKFLFDVAKSLELPNHLDSHPYFNKLYKNPTLGVLVSYFIRLLIMIKHTANIYHY